MKTYSIWLSNKAKNPWHLREKNLGEIVAKSKAQAKELARKQWQAEIYAFESVHPYFGEQLSANIVKGN